VVYPEDEGVATVLRGWAGDARVLLPALRPGDRLVLGRGRDVDGIVVLGSKASVHDSHRWLDELSAWLLPVLAGDTRIPLLGICFGHQLIAHLAGGAVGYLHDDRAQELGVRETVLEPGRLVPERRVARVVASHREEVKRTPPGYRVAAHCERVPVDGLEHESLPVIGFQFHPEAGRSFLEARGVDGSQLEPGMIAEAESLLSAFRRLVLARGAV